MSNDMSNTTNSTLVSKALEFATVKHEGQFRKGKDESPYINHPIALVDVLTKEADIDDPAILCAALLHDTIEDTNTTHKELVDAFGQSIADIVLEVTDDKGLAKKERKEHQIAHAPHLSSKAKAVKLADKTSNLRDIISSPPANWDTQRKLDYFDWAKAVIDGLRGEWPVLESIFDAEYSKRQLMED